MPTIIKPIKPPINLVKGYCYHCKVETKLEKEFVSEKLYELYGVVGYAKCSICYKVAKTYYLPRIASVLLPYRYYMCSYCNKIFKFPEKDIKKKDCCPFCGKTGQKKYRVTKGRL